MMKIINFSLSSQETATAGQSLTDYKFEMLSTREGVKASFERELHNQRNNKQEIADKYDQGENFGSISIYSWKEFD